MIARSIVLRKLLVATEARLFFLMPAAAALGADAKRGDELLPPVTAVPGSSLSVTNNIPVSTASSHVSVAIPNTTVTGGATAALLGGGLLATHSHVMIGGRARYHRSLGRAWQSNIGLVPGSSFTPLLRATEEINFLLGQENLGMCLEN